MQTKRPKTAGRIKAPTHSSSLVDPQQSWTVVDLALRQIYNNNASSLSFETTFRSAYMMVLQRAGNKLYSQSQQVISELVQDAVEKKITPILPDNINISSGIKSESNSSSNEQINDFLLSLELLWNHHNTCKEAFKGILMYVDRVHVDANGLPTIGEMVTNVFRDIVMLANSKQILNVTVDAVLHEVERHRERENIQESIIKHIIDMLNSLKVNYADTDSLYVKYFEPEFLKSTRRYYALKFQKLINQYDTPSYLRQINLRLEDERSRIHSYLLPFTLSSLLEIVNEELLENHLVDIVDCKSSGLCTMFYSQELNNMALMYNLLKDTPTGLQYMRQSLCNFIKESCNVINTIGKINNPSIVRQQEMTQKRVQQLELKNRVDETSQLQGSTDNNGSKEGVVEGTIASSNVILDTDYRKQIVDVPVGTAVSTHWIKQLLILKDKIDKSVKIAFNNDTEFESDLYKELQNGINSHIRAPEFISLYMDENLRKTYKDMVDEDISRSISISIDIFRFITAKDLFEQYYKQHLAKRLLLKKSIGDDWEQTMIAKLKAECGYQFTSKLEGMFKDMTISNDLRNEYKKLPKSDTLDSSNKHEPELNVNILTGIYWPVKTTADSISEVEFPNIIAKSMTKFKEFYLSKHQGRKLTWLPHLGNADLKVVFDKGVKELNVPTFAMMVLLTIFNDLPDDQKVTFLEIKKKLPTINELDLKRTLQTLSLSKNKILLKNTKTKSISDTDTFIFNRKFNQPNYRIKIFQISGIGSNDNEGSNSRPTSANISRANSGNADNEFEVQNMLEKIDESRKNEIEACIVRIMKSRRNMEHSQLISEVVRQMANRFTPDPGMIKTRIEGLIEREYLQRNTEDRRMYTYLA